MNALATAGVMPAKMLIEGAAGKLIVTLIVLLTLGLMVWAYKNYKGSLGKTLVPLIGGVMIVAFFINPELITHDLVKLVSDAVRGVIRTVSGG